MKTREQIIEFIKSSDFAYVYGSGKMYATDDEQREEMARLIEDTNYIVPVNDLNEEGGAAELKDEDGTVYKCYNSNEEPLYIAVYDTYRVEDSESGNYVLYEGPNKEEAIQEIIEAVSDGTEWDLKINGDLIWSAAINSINDLKNI